MISELAGYTVAITAARRSLEFGAALERRGANVLYAPAVRIIPVSDDTHLRHSTERCLHSAPDIVVATTGIGFRGWIEAADGWGLSDALITRLRSAELIARGPKVVGAVRAAGLTEAWAPASESTVEVLEHLLTRSLHGKRVAVQLHGEPLGWFLDALRAAGADVIDVSVYRSVLPDDTGPVRRLIAAVGARQVDAVAFTSAAAAANFITLAEVNLEEVQRAFDTSVLAACVGPVTASPLIARGIPVVQPDRFRLGALVKTISDELPKRHTQHFGTTEHTIEIRGQAVVIDGQLRAVPATGMLILRKLADPPGRVVSRGELLTALPGTGSDAHAVEAAIARLRASLHDPALVETVVKRGYRLAM